ncbi:MAG: acetoacetate--CoA ligase [Alphaproteobacteria bacterium]|nr:acetoacetate--CoA ligase [Alphaproteobacteria bacterium]
MEYRTDPIWKPSAQAIEQANMTRFIEAVNSRYGLNLISYEELHLWSIINKKDFHKILWDFCGVIASHKGKQEIYVTHDLFKSKFFEDATLNYAENLLKDRPLDMPAVIFWGEDKVKRTLTYGELYRQVAALAAYLKSIGVEKGDRAGGYVPNTPEALIAMLAVTSLGAIWSSCSPDFGVSGVVDRFGQITPKILFMAEGYFYNGKRFDCLSKIDDFLKDLPSLEKIIVYSYTQEAPSLPNDPKVVAWEEALKLVLDVESIDFVQVPFNHPAFILYSSGTTGAPKCIVHGGGGTLLQHLKDHQLHSDIKPGDRVFYFTTCGWMMWNWQVSALASNATLCLFDGSPAASILWEYAEREKITHFGTSAKYIDFLQKSDIHPKNLYDLSSIRMIASTGSPLAPESFDFVYEHISSDVHLASISGGTDIISCFALGNPVGPLWRGELQVGGLGMDVCVFNEAGHPVIGHKGELVCRSPFPSMPICFWNDENDRKYYAAYFKKFPGVWCHGDYVEHTIHGGFIIYGRSDTVLNPGGVRIGTAEIYRQVEQIPEVMESLVVGQDWEGDVRIILFLILKAEFTLTPNLMDKIKQHIRLQASPRHVPAKMIQVADIPRTKSGKIVEVAVREIIHRRPVLNTSALANPEVLKLYEGIEELQRE